MERLHVTQFSGEELEKRFNYLDTQITNLKENFQPKNPTEYLTRKETATLLKVDLSTLYNWHKKKILSSYGIGGRLYYKRSEVEKAIVKLNNCE